MSSLKSIPYFCLWEIQVCGLCYFPIYWIVKNISSSIKRGFGHCSHGFWSRLYMSCWSNETQWKISMNLPCEWEPHLSKGNCPFPGCILKQFQQQPQLQHLQNISEHTMAVGIGSSELHPMGFLVTTSDFNSAEAMWNSSLSCCIQAVVASLSPGELKCVVQSAA